jgi:hypothetical protein
VNDWSTTLLRRACSAILAAGFLPAVVWAQTPFTLNLIGSYLTAAAQMNMAVGREVIP